MIEPYWTSKDGKHVVYCGDCEKVLNRLNDIGCVITDPPYGISKIMKGGGGGRRSSWNFSQNATAQWDKNTVDTVLELPKFGDCIIWGGNYYALPPSRGWLVWDKQQPDTWTTGQCELAWTNLEVPVRAFRMCQAVAHDEMRPKKHPTQKPLSLIEWCFKWIKETEQYVLDPFMGSGTTGVACVRLNRRFIGIEISQEYCDIAVERIKRELSQPRLELEPQPSFEQASLLPEMESING